MHARCSEVCAEKPVLTSVLNYALNNFIDNPGTVSLRYNCWFERCRQNGKLRIK